MHLFSILTTRRSKERFSWKKYGSRHWAIKSKHSSFVLAKDSIEPLHYRCKAPKATYFSLFDTRLAQACVAYITSNPQPTLHILQLTMNNNRLTASPVSTYPAICAAPVQSTRAGSGRDGIKDLLCLREDGSLFLVCPGGIIEVCIHVNRSGDLVLLSEQVLPSSVAGTSQKIIELVDPVRASVTVIYSDGSRHRVSTDLTPQSPLVNSCFLTLSQICPSEMMLRLRLEFLARWSRLARCGHPTEEFECFSAALLENLSASSAEAAMDVDTEVDTNDGWSFMAKHDIHTRLLNDPALQYLYLPSSDTQRSKSPSGARNHPEVAAVLHGLHLLGEELKVDNMRHHELKLLIPLLIELAHSVGSDWGDYWLRIFPDGTLHWNLSPSSKQSSFFALEYTIDKCSISGPSQPLASSRFSQLLTRVSHGSIQLSDIFCAL
jgi:hypothetical protein